RDRQLPWHAAPPQSACAWSADQDERAYAQGSQEDRSGPWPPPWRRQEVVAGTRAWLPRFGSLREDRKGWRKNGTTQTAAWCRPPGTQERTVRAGTHPRDVQ